MENFKRPDAEYDRKVCSYRDFDRNKWSRAVLSSIIGIDLETSVAILEER